ncbi:hypothetical protein Avbf_01354 [Armadillidium vulgare]|nr:hypothetical protein Avbf_01354 [Armadillidium vulgare]
MTVIKIKAHSDFYYMLFTYFFTLLKILKDGNSVEEEYYDDSPWVIRVKLMHMSQPYHYIRTRTKLKLWKKETRT